MNTINVTNPDTNEVITYTEGEVLRYIKENTELKESNDRTQVRYMEDLRQLSSMRRNITEFFKSNYTIGDQELSFSVDEINEFLESINADTLPQEWSASIRVDITLTGLVAPSEEEVHDLIHENLNIDWTDEGDASIDYIDIREVSS